MNGEEMAIFTRTFDLLSWLMPAMNKFPRAHRHSFTRRLLDAAFDLRLATPQRQRRHSYQPGGIAPGTDSDTAPQR